MMDKPFSVIKGAVYPPFRYKGHQNYLLPSILALVPPHSCYVEPFCGGAGLFFAKPLSSMSWLNDLNPELMATYKRIRDTPLALSKLIAEMRNTERQYIHMRDKCVPRTSLDVAARWFYLNRTSEFSTMDKVWARDRSIRLDSAALIAVVQHASRKLRGVSLTAGDFEKVIDKAPDGAFLFVAPPYSLTRSASRDSQYRVPFSRDDSVRLVEALRRNNRRVHFLLTYRECQEIVDLFSWGENICEYLHYDTRHLGDPTKLPSDEIVTDPEKVNEICIRNYA